MDAKLEGDKQLISTGTSRENLFSTLVCVFKNISLTEDRVSVLQDKRVLAVTVAQQYKCAAVTDCTLSNG